jgi:hypothetical protein
MDRIRQFYVDHFRAEHRHPANVALHMFGVLASAASVVIALWGAKPWLALAYPVVHAVPGLLGHRLFERNLAVGDLRLTRQDFPVLWFILANHLLFAEVLAGRRLVKSDEARPTRSP